MAGPPSPSSTAKREQDSDLAGGNTHRAAPPPSVAPSIGWGASPPLLCHPPSSWSQKASNPSRSSEPHSQSHSILHPQIWSSSSPLPVPRRNPPPPRPPQSSLLRPQLVDMGLGPAGLGLVAVHRTNRADEPNPGCSRVPLPVLLVLPLLVPLQIQKADLAPIYLTSGDRRGHGILQFGFRARESREKKIEPKFPPNMFPRQFGSRCNFSGFLR